MPTPSRPDLYMEPMSLAMLHRFISKIKVNAESECWEWNGLVASNGYGLFHVEGEETKVSAHRLAYRYFVGPLTEGMELDHLCRIKCCVNPKHLEEVTPEENIRRRSVLYTHCFRGHEMTADNILWSANRTRKRCRACNNIRAAWHRRKAKAEKAGLPFNEPYPKGSEEEELSFV